MYNKKQAHELSLSPAHNFTSCRVGGVKGKKVKAGLVVGCRVWFSFTKIPSPILFTTVVIFLVLPSR